MQSRMRLNELEGKKVRIGINTMQLIELQNELPKLLSPFNQLRKTIKSAIKSDDVNENYRSAFNQLASFILEGFPDGTVLSWAARAKGIDEQLQAASKYLKNCKQVEDQHKEYMQLLILKNGEYLFDDEIKHLLNELAGNYIIGKTAITIHHFVEKFLNDFEILAALQENKILADPLKICQATPLIYLDIDRILKPNHHEINRLAQVLENIEPTENEKAILKILKNNIKIDSNKLLEKKPSVVSRKKAVKNEV